MSDETRIKCELCGMEVHAIQSHLKTHHEDVTLEQYRERFPQAPILSDYARRRAADIMAKKAQAGDVIPSAVEEKKPETAPAFTFTVSTDPAHQPFKVVKRALSEVFGLSKSVCNGEVTKKPIMITTYEETKSDGFIPQINDTYVYDPEELKSLLLGLEMNIPCYVWGHKGSGKSELWEQVAARTGRPMVRLQHTGNTEESQITGQWTVKDGETVFSLGPLPLAMMNGWLFLADEYDFALPNVLSVYQAVLEGKPLYIKDAPEHLRIIKPHPAFRIVGTGNTNGAGDDTGLYQGTSVQNSANYDRWGMVIHKQYMKTADETAILVKRTGLAEDDGKKMVQFATLIREAYASGKLSDTISPRALINATMIGMAKGSFHKGIAYAFSNKLSVTDQKIANDIASRVFPI